MEFDTTTAYTHTYSFSIGNKLSDYPRAAYETKLAKCNALKDLLVENWHLRLHKVPFISLLDSHKVAFSIAVQDLNRILQESMFTDTERKRVKKLRYQGRNNRAAQTLRIKNKHRDDALSYDLFQLEQIKESLQNEKERLSREILFYQKASTTSTN